MNTNTIAKYGYFDETGRLYRVEIIDTAVEGEPPASEAIRLRDYVDEVISDNPLMMTDYVVRKNEAGKRELVRESLFEITANAPAKQVSNKPEQLIRVAAPDQADVLLDGDELILQASTDDDPVRITLTQPDGRPIVTVTLDAPQQVEVPGRVIAYKLSGGVRTFFQRLATR